jgi:hypothetical protein
MSAPERFIRVLTENTPMRTPPDAEDHQVQAIVRNAQARTDSTEALRVLNKDYVEAPPNIKDAILHNAGAQQIFARAARKANEPLTREIARPALLQEQTHKAILNLRQATRDLNKDFAAAISDFAAGDYETVHDYHECNGDLPDDGLFGPIGAALLRGVVDRIASTPQGDKVASRFIAMAALYYDANKAVNEAQSAQQSLNDTRALASQGDAAAQVKLREGSLQQKANAATAKLNAVVAAEIAGKISMIAEVGVGPGDAQATRAGQDIVAGYADDPETQKLVRTAVEQVLDGRQAKAEAQIQAAVSKHSNVATRRESPASPQHRKNGNVFKQPVRCSRCRDEPLPVSCSGESAGGSCVLYASQ